MESKKIQHVVCRLGGAGCCCCFFVKFGLPAFALFFCALFF